MKRYKFLIVNVFVISILLSIIGCVESVTLPLVSKYSVQVNMPMNVKDNYLYANKIVTLRSQRMIYTAETDANGLAQFKNIIPDIYDVYTSWDLTSEQYVEMNDSLVENKPALISGISALKKVFSDSTISMNTLLTVKQDLLISKVYASGTKDINNGKYDVDQYVEIFNNSDITQYVDGLYLALVEGDSPIAFSAKNNPTDLHARQVFRFPGDGDDYPILPGKSMVVCNSAINHLENALISVNLQNADFEFKNTLSKPINNDAVKAMILIHTSYVGLNSLNLQKGGVNSICLFKTTENVSLYPLDYPPGKTSGNRFLRIPAKYIFDGIEVLGYKSTGVDPNSKRLQDFIDAGYKTISATSGNTHESIERKVDIQRSTTSRIYLIDTNNSRNDLVILTDPTQKKYDKTLLLQ